MDANRTDEWGRPILTTPGHSAWSCNDRACQQHPACLYGQPCSCPKHAVTNTRRAGGVVVMSGQEETSAFHRRQDAKLGELRVSAPLGVETGEAWNAPLGDTWRSILTREGTIGGLRLA